MSAGEDVILVPAAAPSFIAKHAVLSGAALQAAPGCFRAPGQRELVLGRVVSLELLAQRADGSLEVILGALRNCRRVALTRPRARAQSVWEQPAFDTILDLTVLPWSGAEASAHVRRRTSRTPVVRTLTLWLLASQPLYGRDLLLVSAGGSRRSAALMCKTRFLTLRSCAASGHLNVLAFDVASHRFATLQRLELPSADAAWRRPGWRVAVDTLARCVVVSSLDGTLAATAVVRPGRDLAQPLSGFVADGGVALQRPCWSLSFCHTSAESPPTLVALLPSDECDASADGHQLAVVTVDSSSHISLHHFLSCGLAETNALEMLPVPGAPGLVVLLCVGLVALIRLGESARVVFAIDVEPAGAVPAASLWLPRAGENSMPAFLLSNDMGTLAVVHVDVQSLALFTTRLSPPNNNAQAWPCISSMAWLPGGCVLICSHDGDSHVLRLPELSGSKLAEPIVTAIVSIIPSTALTVDVVDHSGALMLGSGTKLSGTLRQLHAGVEVRQLLLSAPTFAVTAVWPISTGPDAAHDVLIISFVDATRALELHTSDWRDVSDELSLNTQSPTLAAGMLEPGVLVQVCAHGVRAMALQHAAAGGVSGVLLNDWHLAALPESPALQRAAGLIAPDAVAAAAVGEGFVLLGVAHAKALVLLHLSCEPSGVIFAPVRVIPLAAEASCMCITRCDAARLGAFGAPPRNEAVAVVGTYQPLVALFSLAPGAELEVLASWTPDDDTGLHGQGVTESRDLLPHAVHVAAFADHAGVCLLVGTRGGALLRLECGTQPRMLCCTNVRLLGRLPLDLVPLGAGALIGDVLALSDRPWLVRFISGMQRVNVQPLAPPAASVASCAAALAPPGAPPCVLLVNGARLRLVTLLGAPHQSFTSTVTPLWSSVRRLHSHRRSGALLVSYALAPEETHGAIRHELIAMHIASGLPVSSVARMRTGESVHALSVWHSEETDDVLVLVGTSLGLQPGTPPEECPLGRLLVMRLDVLRVAGSPAADEDGEPTGPRLTGSSQWLVVAEAHLPGAVLAVAGGPGDFVAVSSGATVYALQLLPGHGVPAAISSLERIASIRLRDVVTGLAWHGSVLAACDARDGAHLLQLNAEQRTLEFICSERVRRQARALAACADCAAGIDAEGCFLSFSTAVPAAVGQEAERAGDVGGLTVNAQYGIGCTLSAICARSASVLPSFAVSTVLGGVIDFKPLDEATFALLSEVEACVATHPLTAPLLGADHVALRDGPPLHRRVLDGDLLAQLLHLPERMQRDVLSRCPSCAMDEDASAMRILELLSAALR